MPALVPAPLCRFPRGSLRLPLPPEEPALSPIRSLQLPPLGETWCQASHSLGTQVSGEGDSVSLSNLMPIGECPPGAAEGTLPPFFWTQVTCPGTFPQEAASFQPLGQGQGILLLNSPSQKQMLVA